MGIQDFLLPLATTESEKTVNDALQRYFAMKAMTDFGETASSQLFGLHDLEDEDHRLDIALKRRQLGLEDSEDFNDTPTPRLLAALGINFAQKLRAPQPLAGAKFNLPIKGLENVSATIRSSSGTGGAALRRAIGAILR